MISFLRLQAWLRSDVQTRRAHLKLIRGATAVMQSMPHCAELKALLHFDLRRARKAWIPHSRWHHMPQCSSDVDNPVQPMRSFTEQPGTVDPDKPDCVEERQIPCLPYSNTGPRTAPKLTFIPFY